MTDGGFKLLSDFNIEPLGRYISNSPGISDLTVSVAPFGQVYQALAQMKNEALWGIFVWTQPARLFPSFSRAFNLEEVDHSLCLDEVDHFAEAIIAAGKNKHVLVAAWGLPFSYRGYGVLDWRPALGIKHLLAEMNLRLASRLAGAKNILLLDAERWLQNLPQAESPKMWYAAKVPFVSPVFERAAVDIAHAIKTIRGLSRRLIVVDLDNTLWGGIVGEMGWEGICLGGHDHIGESYKDFQRELKSLSNRGVQLAIVSKNDESVGLAAIDQHPEMILKRTDFVGWRINWQDKARNIAALAEELRIGLASMVFIDDNHAERDRVAQALPAVMVPDWPSDPTEYVLALRGLNCFDSLSIGKEDRERKAMYAAERTRSDARLAGSSLDEWLHRLNTRLRVTKVDQRNSSRVAQLFNKTNQLNLSTRRLSEAEILEWAKSPVRTLLAISASDQFGDMGLIGILGVEAQEGKGHLIDFMLSCRVMGRKIEETMIHLAASELLRLGAEVMQVQYHPTERNRPTLDVFHNAGLIATDLHRFEVDIRKGFPKPDSVLVDFDPEPL